VRGRCRRAIQKVFYEAQQQGKLKSRSHDESDKNVPKNSSVKMTLFEGILIRNESRIIHASPRSIYICVMSFDSSFLQVQFSLLLWVGYDE